MTAATHGSAGEQPAAKTAGDYELESLRRENAKLRDRVHMLGQQVAALRNDGDLREERALDTAQDCAVHGARLAHLEATANWHWAAAGQQEVARYGFLGALRDLLREMWQEQQQRGEPILLPEIAARVEQAIDAQYKIRRRPAGWPALETYLHQDCVCSQPGGDARSRLRELRLTLGDVLWRFNQHRETCEPGLGHAALRTGWELKERVERWRAVLALYDGDGSEDFARQSPPAELVQGALFASYDEMAATQAARRD